MDWVAVMLDEDRRRRMAGEDGGESWNESAADRLHQYQAYLLFS